MPHRTPKQAALHYLSMGLSVVPVRGKTPLIEWSAYQKALPTEANIELWWRKYPDAGVGIITGKVSGIIVVDIDGGEVPPLPPTIIAQSSPGHFHYYYKYPGKHVPPSVKKLGPNMDIRGDGGLVIAPPSRHYDEHGKCNGTYQWLEQEIDPSILGLLPEWITTGSTEARTGISELIGNTKGSRNNNAASLAGKLLALLPESDWPTVWEIINAANSLNMPPLDLSELRRIFDSIARIETQKRANKIASQSLTNKGALQWVEPINIDDLEAQYESIPWIWENYLAKGCVTLFVAPPKTGKTTLLAWLLISLRLGQHLAGFQASQIKALVVSEESKTVWSERKKKYDIKTNVWIHSQPFHKKPNSKEWAEFLTKEAEFCEVNGIELIVLDTISEFWPVRDENAATDVNEHLLPLRKFTDRNMAVLILHHTRKAEGENGTAARGSSAIIGFPDIIFEMKKVHDRGEKFRTLSSVSRINEALPGLLIELTLEGYVSHGQNAKAVQSEKIDVLLELFPEPPNGITSKQILVKWKSVYGTSLDPATIHRRLQDLKRAKKISVVGIMEGKGKAQVWSKVIALQDEHKGDAMQRVDESTDDYPEEADANSGEG